MSEWQTYSKRPTRAPIEIPTLLKEYYAGKRMLEIGFAYGDFIPMWAQHAREVIGYEMDRDRYLTAINRDDLKRLRNISLFNAEVTGNETFEVDCYYYWGNKKEDTFKLCSALQSAGHTGAFCTYGGIHPSSHPRRVRPSLKGKFGLFDSEEQMNKWADRIISFKPSEKDGRKWYDKVAKGKDLVVAIKYL